MKTLIRDAEAEDLPFIINSWVKSSKNLTPMWRGVPNSVYSSKVAGKIEKLMDTSEFKVKIAGDLEGLILSYLVFQEFKHYKVYHYGYTKKQVRHLGLFTSLLRASEVPNFTVYTHTTTKSREYFKEAKTILFNPFLFLEL